MTEQCRNTPAGEPPSGAGGPEWCAGACKPSEARRAVARVVVACCRAGRPCGEHAVSDAQLVASELTTNAILHGGGVTEFQVELVGCEVRVCVSDRSDRLPVARAVAADDGRSRLGGRGWPIVCRLARDVEVLDLPSGGKRISAVVPLS